MTWPSARIIFANSILPRQTPQYSLPSAKRQGDDLAKFRQSSEVCEYAVFVVNTVVRVIQ